MTVTSDFVASLKKSAWQRRLVDVINLSPDETQDRYDQDGPGLLDPSAPASPAEPPPGLAEPPTDWALYRRYRPDNFAHVIGQDHITEPLIRALTNNKVSHAYLFSGPRGCGKTSSARILARCLNCSQGPTSTPCGQCQSCRDLATGGPGSIDVIEMDAATHGLVDDARDLRERAFFQPVQSRYKVYIIDEAHMVTTAGFNALLKLVEEPPPHVKFVFATTEPEKVIGTIRSRTHHYPFRLVPPKIMATFLERICTEEKAVVEDGVLALVVRAGAGCVRDALSVLDQLLGAADDQSVGYQSAAALLGYTPDTLLDETIEALDDGAKLFATIDKVIEAGQDPRHFAADLLQRLRDLLIVASVPEALSSGLITGSADQGQRWQAQAEALGRERLTLAAEVVARGLTAMRGTTAPRLHLELMCARLLLPETNTAALARRLDKVERRLVGGVQGFASAGQNTAQMADSSSHPSAPPTATTKAPETAVGGRFTEAEPPTPSAPRQQRPAQVSRQPPKTGSAPGPEPANNQSAVDPTETTKPGETISLPQMRQAWPKILAAVKERRNYSSKFLSDHAEIIDVTGNLLTLGFSNTGARQSYLDRTAPVLVEALAVVTGVPWRVTAILSAAGSTATETASSPPPATTASPRPETDKPESSSPPEGSPDDPDVDDDPTSLLLSELGAEVIAEEPNNV